MKNTRITKHAILLVGLGILLNGCGGNETSEPTTTPEAPQAMSYHEKHRPQFHYSPKEKWANDPNGMVYFDGEYHLFYQHYPDSSVWGPMHWGHAVSKDLVHWENLPIALYPDSLGYIFSGSAVVDWKNTSEFGQNGQPPLVAMYTYHDEVAAKAGSDSFQSQGIAFSNDRGRTWTKYTEGNPVMPNPGKVRDIRDPKLIWHEASKQWVAALAVGDFAEFWASPDLKKWRKLSEFGKALGNHGGVWECPDLFPMTVDGTGETKWVLIININPGQPNGGSGTQYFVGNFDGETFTPDPSFLPFVQGGKAVWLDGGKDNYAGVTWSDAPAGRRLFIGWMSNWQYANLVPTQAWRNAMTLPRSLSLKKTAVGYRLFSEPVQELQTLRTKVFEVSKTKLAADLDLTSELGFAPTLSEMELEFELPQGFAGSFGVELSNAKGEQYQVGYDADANLFFSDRTKAGESGFSADFAKQISTAPRFSKEKTLKMHLFFDVSSAELFADRGETAMTEIFFPSSNFTQLKLFSEGGQTTLSTCKVYQLKGIWK